MIKSFQDKMTEKFYITGKSRKIPSNIQDSNAYNVKIVDYH